MFCHQSAEFGIHDSENLRLQFNKRHADSRTYQILGKLHTDKTAAGYDCRLNPAGHHILSDGVGILYGSQCFYLRKISPLYEPRNCRRRTCGNNKTVIGISDYFSVRETSHGHGSVFGMNFKNLMQRFYVNIVFVYKSSDGRNHQRLFSGKNPADMIRKTAACI